MPIEPRSLPAHLKPGRARVLIPPPGILEWGQSFVLHALTGVLAVFAHYSLMWLLVWLGATPLLASGSGFAAGAATRYLLSYFKVFSPTGSVPATVVRFLAALGAQMVANIALLDFFMKAGLQLWSAQVGATVLLTFANFLVYRLWVFR